MSARLLILSDSHGYTGELSNILMKAESMGALDGVIHLGDGYHDLEPYLEHLPPVLRVSGNCDFAWAEKVEFTRQFGAPLLLSHGHLYHVKAGYAEYAAYARSLKARAALFGHTHEPYLLDQDGLLLLNPGAAANGRFAILTIDQKGVRATLY